MSDARKTDLAKIHLAKKNLAMTDDSYRALLHRVTGKESAAALSPLERAKVMQEFTRLGWAPKPAKRQKPEDWRMPRIRLIHRLWYWLADHGQVRERNTVACEAFCLQHMSAQRLKWATSDELNKCVQALKSWQKRTQKEPTTT